MARTFIRQSDQISKSDTYNDAVDTDHSEATWEIATVDLEQDLNYLRTQVNRILNADGSGAGDIRAGGKWYNSIVAPSSFSIDNVAKKRGVSTLNSDLHELERKRVLTSFISLEDVTVPAAQNWVVLAADKLPSSNAIARSVAVGETNHTGSVAANVTIGSHSLSEVLGATAISPKNLVALVSGSNRDPILSGSNVIYGLFQTEVADTTGGYLGGTSPNRAQISFVTVNETGDDLEACAPAAIAGQVINYILPVRKALKDLSEQDFLRGAEIDVPSTSATSRKNGYDNQGATAFTINSNATLDLGSGYAWEIGDKDSASLFKITEGSTGDTSTVLIDSAVQTFQVKADSNIFDEGITVDGEGTDIEIGITAGTIATQASNDLKIVGGDDLFFNDSHQSTSDWSVADGIKLADTALEWTTFSGSFGEVSLLKAIYQSKRRDKVYATVSSNVAANAAVSGSRAGFTGHNLSAVLPQMASGSFTTDYDVYLNGQLLQGGGNAGADNDYYKDSDDAHTLRFEFGLKQGDVICVVPYVRD
jgi:hypothetical protein